MHQHHDQANCVIHKKFDKISPVVSIGANDRSYVVFWVMKITLI